MSKPVSPDITLPSPYYKVWIMSDWGHCVHTLDQIGTISIVTTLIGIQFCTTFMVPNHESPSESWFPWTQPKPSPINGSRWVLFGYLSISLYLQHCLPYKAPLSSHKNRKNEPTVHSVQKCLKSQEENLEAPKVQYTFFHFMQEWSKISWGIKFSQLHFRVEQINSHSSHLMFPLVQISHHWPVPLRRRSETLQDITALCNHSCC